MIVYKGFEREDVTSDLSIHGTRGFLLAVSPVALVGLVVCIQDRCIKWEAAADVGLTAFRDEHGVCVGGGGLLYRDARGLLGGIVRWMWVLMFDVDLRRL